MLREYLKLASRLFIKNKQYFLFNLTNLSLGIVCGILVLLYLQSYLGFDKHHKNHSRIYRVGYEYNTEAGRTMGEARSSELIGNMLKDECPEVEAYVRFRPYDNAIVKYGGKSFNESEILYADTSIFDVFTHDFIAGSAGNFRGKNNSTVLVKSMAYKYFGDSDPIGKIIEIDSTIYEVAGVIEDLPENVHLKFSMLLRFEPIGTQWFTATCYTYLLMHNNSDINGIYSKYPQLFDKHMSEQAQRIKARIDIVLEPLADIHYKSYLPRDFPQGNLTYIWIFAIVGLFIVLITAINYINMSTAFSLNRAKEIGIKKIFGADIKTLRIYFLLESVLISMLAYIVSLLFVRLIIGSDKLYQLFNVELQFKLFGNFDLYLWSLGLAIVIGLVSGLYPAVHLSSIPSLGAASSSFEHKKRSSFLRNSLIVFQFIIALSVLIGVFAMNKQMNYVNSKDLGYTRENLIVIPVDKLEHSEIPIFKESLLRNPNILSASSSYLLPNSQETMCNFRIETRSGFEEQLFNWSIVDYDYFETMNVEFVEGRDFSIDFESDVNSAYIVNESFIRHYGWDKAIDKRMQIINGGYFRWPEGQVIGVVKDFHFASLHKEIEPIIFVLLAGGYMHIRVNGLDTENTITEINEAWSAIAPDTDMDLIFMNEHLSQSYLNEVNQFSMVKIFSVICIILSCLGLIGLSAYTIARRTKEVAIRKQLGASIAQLMLVLYKDIAVLILIACCIAIPLSTWAINLWMDSFIYRVSIGVSIFVVSSLIAFLIGFVSVLYHSLKVAYLNPVETLKCE